MSVPVHQTLHGYQRGHRLLASGGDVNDEELALLDRYSDLSGYLPPDLDFEVYHTGFPCGRYYSFAATWPDRENRRGGCVLTHTLLVPKAAAGATGDLWTLGELHRRPESAADSDQVSGALTWEPGESSPPRPDPGRSEAAVALFFGQPDRPVLWMEVAPPADVIRCLWWLAWPGLRRRLAFCTMALQVRSLTGRPFDLLGLPPEAQGAFHDQADSPAWWEHTELRSRRLRELVKQDWVRATIEGGAPAVHRLAAAYRTRRAPDPQPWELGLLWRAETLRPAARERLSAARSYADLLDKLGVPDRHPKWREALRALIDRQEQAPLDPNPLWDLTDLLRRAQLRASLARDGELVEHVQGVVADELLRRLREAPAASASALPELLSVAPPPLVRGLVEATLLATRETRDVSSARSVSAALLTAAFATRDDMLAVRMLETAPDSERAGLVTAVADARSEEEGEGFWEWIASVAGQLREHRLLFDAWVRRGDPAAGIRAVAACLDPDSGAARSVLSEVVEELDPEIVLSWALECQDPRLSEVAAQHAARAAPALSVPLSELARRCADAANGVPVFTALAGTEGSTTLSAALEAEPDLRAAVVGWPQPTPVHFGFERVWDAAFRATPDGDGSLLDQVMILYGSGMSNSNLHNIQKLPVLLAGGGAGQLRGGRHIRYADETPLTNLYMALLGKLDVPVERIGDSTGTLQQLTDI